MIKKNRARVYAKNELKKLPTEFNLDSLTVPQQDMNRQPRNKKESLIHKVRADPSTLTSSGNPKNLFLDSSNFNENMFENQFVPFNESNKFMNSTCMQHSPNITAQNVTRKCFNNQEERKVLVAMAHPSCEVFASTRSRANQMKQNNSFTVNPQFRQSSLNIPKTPNKMNPMNISIDSDDINNRSFCYPQNSQIFYSPVNVQSIYSCIPNANMRCNVNGTPYEAPRILTGFNYFQNAQFNNCYNTKRMSSKETIQSKSNNCLNQTINPTQISRLSLQSDHMANPPQKIIMRSVTTVPNHTHSCQNLELAKLSEQIQSLKNENQRLSEENRTLKEDISNISKEKEKLVVRLNQANTKAYHSQQNEEVVMKLK